jgi:ArsR family transcriptional regulator
MEEHTAIAALGALASEPRLAVFRLLVRRGPQGFTPSELAERLKIPAPTLSFHLKELLRADLIISRREGRNLFYSPYFEHMNALVAFLTDNCCTLADGACGSDCQPVEAPKRKRA